MKQREGLITLIGLFKLVKSAALVVASGAMFAAPAKVQPLISQPWLPTHDRQPLELGALAYAAVFLIEGLGLLWHKRWAEWMTVAVTASFMPFEIYEIAEKPSALRIATLVVNALIVVYLLARRLQERFHPGMLRVS